MPTSSKAGATANWIACAMPGAASGVTRRPIE
jgi:hypothetical protein